MEREHNPTTLKIEFSNIDPEQAVAILRFAKNLEHAGKMGASRKICFYADGDGAFAPRISTNLPQELEDQIRSTWNGDDFDVIVTD